MVNNYRREIVMAHKPGYRMRGSGTWIAPRAGSFYRSVDDDLYYRGAGFRDWIKNAASSAFSALIKFIVPHVKQAGPDLAQMMTKYAANKASDYIKRSDRLGAAEGLVSQALSDLPSVVKDLVQKQIDDKFEPLTERALEALRVRGGASRENREYMAEQSVLDAMPYIEQELEPLRAKLDLIHSFAEQLADGKARDAHGTLAKLSTVMTSENPNGALTPLAQLVETMITAVIQYLAKTNELPPSMARMTEACCRMCTQNTTMTMAPLIAQRMKEHHELGLDMGPQVSNLAAILPGMGTYEINPDEKRGGFVGGLLMALLPALVSGGMSLIGRAVMPAGDRGGALMTMLPRIEQDMSDTFDQIIRKVIAQQIASQRGSGSNPATSKRHLLAIAGPKQATKRQKVK
jgi:hypothetical protein